MKEENIRRSQAIFDDARLVKRPAKKFLWGYGTETKDNRDYYFEHGKVPTITQLVNFLEIYLMKDIKVVDLRALGKNEEPYAIVCSGFSGRHCH